MKIAFLSHFDKNLTVFRFPVMKALVAQGHEVFAILPKSDRCQILKQAGIQCIHYQVERASLNVFKELKTLWSLYSQLKKLKLDVLHTFMAKPNIYGTFAGRAAKIPLIINSVTGLGSYYIGKSFKFRLVRSLIESLYRLTFKLSNCVVFQNQDDLSLFVNKGLVRHNKAKLIKGSGIDTTAWQAEPKHSKQVVVLMVSRLIAHKGVKEYIAATHVLQETHPEVEFWLVGGTDSGNPTSISEELVENATWLRYFREQDDVKSILSQCDIFVLPSYREGLSRSILEACSMQKAVVTTNTPGCRDIVTHGKNGFLVPVGDVDALVKAIEKLIIDKELRFSFGLAGRERVLSEFDVTTIVDEHISLYQGVA